MEPFRYIWLVRKFARNHSPEALHNARRLRREMTASERVLWECLRRDRLGFRFHRQVPVGPYTLDFYCPAASVCIEVDGEEHVRHRDDARDAYLERLDVLTVRIRSLDLFDSRSLTAERDLEEVRRICERRSGRGPS